MMPFTLLILWIAYSMLEGFREAIYFFAKTVANIYNFEYKFDEHLPFTIQRMIVWCSMVISVGLFRYHDIYQYILVGVSFMFMFPFFHDGSYYLTRHKLYPKIYPKGWFDQSTTTTAKISLNSKSRIVFFILGILVYSFVIIRNYIHLK